MDKKFYVSLEAARLLKEKGYDRECVAYYQHERFHPYSVDLFGLRTYNKNDAPDYMEQYSAPTKSEAIDWLESKGIIVELSYDDKTYIDNVQWEYSIYYHGTDIWIDTMVCCWAEDNYYKKTRLEAEEAAILKALELL